MAAFLSAEWLDLIGKLGARLPEREGASLRLQVVVSGVPGGDVTYAQRFEDGRIIEAGLGEDPDADVVLTMKHADAAAVARGEVAVEAGVMQGRTKMVGTTGSLMAVLPVLQAAEYAELVAAVAAKTDGL